MTLRGRVITTLVAVLAVIGLLGWQLSLRYAQTRESLDVVVEQLTPAATHVSRLESDIDAMDRRLRIYVSSGDRGYRTLYRAAVRAARDNLAAVDDLLGGSSRYVILIEEVRDSLDTWVDSVGAPALAAMADDDPEGAQGIVNSNGAQANYARLTADTYRLGLFIASDRDDALADSADAARTLAWTLAVALVVMLLLPIGVYLALRRNVLAPIGNLRAQLREIAEHGHHDTVIRPGGPPEIRDLGRDAEALRRALVHEIDQATAAQAALEQEGPVVEAIRRELAASSDAQPVGVVVAGFLRPAEGLLAGDFWDRTPLGDGRTAAVVCDVSGHGPRAGVVAMRIKTALMLGLLAGQEPPQILHRACDTFADEPARFATVVILVADPLTGELRWVNAGHPAPRIVRAGGSIERLESTGPMLSWLGGVWTTGTTRLGPADLCLAFTDGILESRDADGEELGDDELDRRLLLAVNAAADPREVIAQTLAGVRQRADDLGRDDLTLVAMRMDPQNSGIIPSPRR